MKVLQSSAICISLLLLSSCAHTAKKSYDSNANIGASSHHDTQDTLQQPTALKVKAASPQTLPTAESAITTLSASKAGENSASQDHAQPSLSNDGAKAPSDEIDVENDYKALYGPTTSSNAPASATRTANTQLADPWEGYNRRIHRFNVGIDRTIAHPLAVAYVKVVPAVCRLGVSHFFDNLSSPMVMVNQFLQGHPLYSIQTFGRFVLNTIMGVGGILDPASVAGIPRRRSDFGETLAVWGWRHSRYFELPFFGPRTVRDTIGMVGDYPLSPLHTVQKDDARFLLQGLQLVNMRANLLPLDSIRQSALDEYRLTRDAWLQQRNYHIRSQLSVHAQSQEQTQDIPVEQSNLEEEGTVPINAIPIPPQLIH